jgi:porin
MFNDVDGVEVFYNIQVKPWLHITPDFQYINPGDNRIDDAYVAGVRMKIDI